MDYACHSVIDEKFLRQLLHDLIMEDEYNSGEIDCVSDILNGVCSFSEAICENQKGADDLWLMSCI